MEWIKWCSKRFKDTDAKTVARIARALGRLEEELSMHVEESGLTARALRSMFDARVALRADADRREQAQGGGR